MSQVTAERLEESERVWRSAPKTLSSVSPSDLSAAHVIAAADKFGSILPLPLPRPPPQSSSSSHRVRARRHRRLFVFEQTVELVASINRLYSGNVAHGFGCFCVDATVASAQVNALNGFIKDAARLTRGRRELALTGAEATRRLTKAESVDRYSVKFKSHAQVELVADLLDEPSHDTVVRLLEA